MFLRSYLNRSKSPLKWRKKSKEKYVYKCRVDVGSSNLSNPLLTNEGKTNHLLYKKKMAHSSTLNRDLLYEPCPDSLNFRNDTILVDIYESFIFGLFVFLR